MFQALNRALMSRKGPILTGIAVGILAPLLTFWGNPGNMGICVACFTRDIAGALGLHRGAVVQYIRPELAGFILGSFISSLIFREYKPRTGSSPIVRFFLGFFAMIGALVFLGCPWRAYIRLSAGDLNAIPGILGLTVGVAIGISFLWRGFSLGRNYPAKKPLGYIMPLAAITLIAFVLLRPSFGPEGSSAIFFSEKGPGSMAAPVALSLAAGLLIGWLAQRSRFCTVGALRDLIMFKDFHLFNGIIAFVIAAFVTNLLLGQFKLGFEGQPIAHTNVLWNAMGMVLSGLAFTLAGGCPGRQFIMSGEGDGDAAVFILGMLFGAATAHNFSLASSGTGPGAFGPAATIIGIMFCLSVGFLMREKI